MKKIWTLISSLFFKKEKQNVGESPIAEQPNVIEPVQNPPKRIRVSQQSIVADALIQKGTISVNELKSIGIYRTTKVVCELRKKGWQIKTKVLMVGGKKLDIYYTLQEHPNLPIA